MLIYDTAEAVASNWFVEAEFILIHIPQLHPSDARIFLAYLMNVLEGELLTCRLGMYRTFIILIVSLLTYTKQFTESPDTVASGVL